MSLKDHRQPTMAHPGGGGLNRSQSFGGYIGARTPSPTSPLGVPVLGEGYRRSPMINRKSGTGTGSIGFSFRKSPKVPKVPRPPRALLMFISLRKGLQECIQATEDDISNLRASEDLSAGSSTGQQVKAAERYQKRLEFQLSKVEELEENYVLQEQLREGVRNMAKAYTSLPSNNKKESLNNVKFGYKECTQTMCAIEAQLENMLGTFHCKMKGLVGFSRLIPGDVFEVTLRHGPQKWKTKGRITTSGQRWDNDYMVLKCLVGDILTIKAVEVKGLGKSMILGQKNCETKDLFSSHPQMMTVNINNIGSLKLSVIVTWNPLEGADEGVTYYEPAAKSQGTPKRRTPLSPTLGPGDPFLNGGSEEFMQRRQTSPDHMLSAREAVRHSMPPNSISEYPHQNNNGFAGHSSQQLRPKSVAIMGSVTDSMAGTTDLNARKPHLFDMRLLAESLDGASCRQEATSLEEAVISMSTTLEDYQGQFPELAKLEEQVQVLDRLIRKNHGGGSPRSSRGSISIETALGAFDFLEQEDYFEGYGSSEPSRRTSLEVLEATVTLSPESTTKTADSGIESIANRLSEERAFGSSVGSSPEPPSTGNDQVDQALLWHLAYCERLLDNLGNFGPLKCKEIYSLDKLRKQADILEKLVQIARAGSQIADLQTVMTEMSSKKYLRQFWVKCVDHNVLVTNAEKFLSQLERGFGDHIRGKYDISASKVFKVLVARVLDVPVFDPETQKPCPNVTLHQLFNFFSEDTADIPEYLEELAGELWMGGRLRSGDTDLIIKTILMFQDSLPPAECLRVVALLLITDNAEVSKASAKYMHSISGNASLREKALVIFVEALEERNADIRCASCIALKLLKATESLDQLVYVFQTDNSPVVKAHAKDSLLSFGDEGRKAVQETELTSHGFQGIQPRLS